MAWQFSYHIYSQLWNLTLVRNTSRFWVLGIVSTDNFLKDAKLSRRKIEQSKRKYKMGRNRRLPSSPHQKYSLRLVGLQSLSTYNKRTLIFWSNEHPPKFLWPWGGDGQSFCDLEVEMGIRKGQFSSYMINLTLWLAVLRLKNRNNKNRSHGCSGSCNIVKSEPQPKVTKS
jgi:hypothetical protein